MRIAVAALVLLLLAVAPSAAAARRVYRVFALISKPSSAYDIGMREVRQVFAQKGLSADFTLDDFDRKEALGQQALARIRAGRYDLVLAMGSEATEFLYRHYRGGPLPVVSAIAKDPVLMGQVKDYTVGSGDNFAFTSLNVPVALQMQYLKELIPHLRNLAVMFSPKNKSAIKTQYLPLLPIAPRYGVRVLAVSAGKRDVETELEKGMPQAIEEMRRTDPTLSRSAFWITGSTEIFDQIHLIDALAGRVPVLSAVPNVVASGEDSAALAIGVTFEDNGYLAGLYAARILAGQARPETLPVGIVSPPDIAINFLKAKEAHLRIPFDFFELANFVYDRQGRLVRKNGQSLAAPYSHP